MPKVSLSLEAAKAKDGEILAKLGRVETASTAHKQHAKLAQQRLDWSEQASKLGSEARRLENDLWEVTTQLSSCLESGSSPATPSADTEHEPDAQEESEAEVWFQVSGVRRLLAQLRQRDPGRLRAAPEQAVSLQDLLANVAAAVWGRTANLEARAVELDRECVSLRHALRRELLPEGAWQPGSRQGGAQAGAAGDLSEEEEALLERPGPEVQSYAAELQRLNEQVGGEVTALDSELADLRRRCKAWDEASHFRFLCILRRLQGRRDLLIDRLSLEFPHLSREQLQAHEATCDALRYNSQKQAAAFRQWRRERAALLQRSRAQHEERQAAQAAAQARRREQLEVLERRQQLQGRLQLERARASSRREERQRVDEQQAKQRLAAEAQRAQGHRRRAQSVKELCREHQSRVQEQQQQQALEAEERERQAAQERAERMDRNVEIVRLRRQMDELRHQENARRRQEAEQEQRDRQQRLQEMLEKIKVQAPRDPARLLKVPSRVQAPAYSDPLVCVTRGPQAGFDERRLMKDARYKLSAALQAAGLFGTAAGHDALKAVPAPRPAQPHIVSQVFAGGYPD